MAIDNIFSKTSQRLSVVVPLYNEQGSIAALVARMHEALADYASPWELILVDDGSGDGTVNAVREQVIKFGPHVRLLQLQRNFGQTAAMQAGIDAARGEVIATMDGDLQNDPVDIPRMVGRLYDEKLDMVVGWRKQRKDKLLLRRIPSSIANRLIVKITRVKLHDYGCSLKVYRAGVIKNVRLYGEMHRFIPAWAAIHTSPDRIKEEVVAHHARRCGTSKYGISRTFRVILDLLAVYFFMRFRARPGHFFGMFGFAVGSLGGLILTYLLGIKVLLGEDIGGRPLFMLGVLLVVMSVQFLTTGVLSELISRTYFESSANRPYVVLNTAEFDVISDKAWKAPSISQKTA